MPGISIVMPVHNAAGTLIRALDSLIGQSVAGVPVMAAEALPGTKEVLVLGYVDNRGARELIRKALASSGRVEGRDFLMCA